MSSAPARVVIMTKDAVPGRVKTRLIPALGPDRAAQLHDALVRHTVGIATATGLAVVVALDGQIDGPLARYLRSQDVDVQPQASGDLGNRLRVALQGPGRHIGIGTDCPLITAADLLAAAQPGQIALGPAEDGGYWFIAFDGSPQGSSPPAHALLRDIPWSTDQTLAVTLERARQAGLTVVLHKTRSDLDRPEDLRTLLDNPACPTALRPFLLAQG